MARDYRIDFFRGLALISIFVNHIPGNLYSNFTHRNFGLSDAAEIFVLLAGISAALAYYPRFISGQAGQSVGRIGKRIGTLYVAHLASIACGFAIYAGASLWLDQPGLMIPDERHWIVEQPVRALAGMGMLSYQTGNFNILPMYMVLMALLPVIMLLARVRLSLVLAASVALWAIANAWRITLPSFPGEGGWYFNPFTWQVLFVIGFVGGILLRRGERIPVSRPLYGLAVAYLVAAAALVFAHLWDYFPTLPEWVWISGFNKSWVGFFRLLHVLAMAYVVLYSPLPALLKRWLDEGNWIVRLGSHTLPVFWTGTILSVTGHIIRESVFGLPNDPTFTGVGMLLDTVLIGVGLSLLFALAWYLDWTRPSAPRSRPAADAQDGVSKATSGMVAAE